MNGHYANNVLLVVWHLDCGYPLFLPRIAWVEQLSTLPMGSTNAHLVGDAGLSPRDGLVLTGAAAWCLASASSDPHPARQTRAAAWSSCCLPPRPRPAHFLSHLPWRHPTPHPHTGCGTGRGVRRSQNRQRSVSCHVSYCGWAFRCSVWYLGRGPQVGAPPGYLIWFIWRRAHWLSPPRGRPSRRSPTAPTPISRPRAASTRTRLLHAGQLRCARAAGRCHTATARRLHWPTPTRSDDFPRFALSRPSPPPAGPLDWATVGLCRYLQGFCEAVPPEYHFLCRPSGVSVHTLLLRT